MNTYIATFVYGDYSHPILKVNETVVAESIEQATAFLIDKYSPTPLLNLKITLEV